MQSSMQKHLFARGKCKCCIKISPSNITVCWNMLVRKHRSNFWKYITSEVATKYFNIHARVWIFLNTVVQTLAKVNLILTQNPVLTIAQHIQKHGARIWCGQATKQKYALHRIYSLKKKALQVGLLRIFWNRETATFQLWQYYTYRTKLVKSFRDSSWLNGQMVLSKKSENKF